MVAMPRYGTPNIDYMVSWLNLDDDGPMWALNLMKYRPVADYVDGRQTTLTGAQADEAYKPDGPLARFGARILLIAEVTAQLAGDGTVWDRVAIAQYPTRAAMMHMQMDDEFETLHEHKDAGMEFTIVNATFPQADFDLPAEARSAVDGDGVLLLEVVADASSPELAATVDSVPIGRFDVEDVIVGDERRWAESRFDLVSPAGAEELVSAGTTRADDRYAVLLEPRLDLVAQSLRDAAAGTYPTPTT
jgi:uncharacterized protein (DUF1330 family)